MRASPTVIFDGRVDEFYRGGYVPRDVRALSTSQLAMSTNGAAAMDAYLAMLAGPDTAPRQAPGSIADGLALSTVVIGATRGSDTVRETGARENVVVSATSRREFGAADRVAAFLRVSQSGARPPASANVTTSIVSHARGAIVSEALHVGSDDFGAARHVDYRYRLPVDELAPGNYVLEIRVESASRTAARSVPFRVR
jgi:hypothetical protein